MKNFVSVNAKYFKDSNAKGQLGHVNRKFKENINTFLEHTKYNFGSEFDSFERYKEINQRRVDITGKNIRKDANTFLDCVVSFSLEQWEALENKHGLLNVQKAMKIMMNNFMTEMHKEFGLEPISSTFHLDEGHIKQIEAYKNQQDRIQKGLLKDDEVIIKQSSLTRNIHAHVIFYNFDFKKKKAPLRKMTKSNFSNFQKIAGKSFIKAGFRHGISKELTGKSHDEKMDFVNKRIKVKENELNEIDNLLFRKKTELSDLEIEIIESKNIFESVKNEIKELFNQFKLNISKYARSLLKLDVNAIDNNIENLQTVVDKTTKIDSETADAIVEEINFYADKYKKLGIGKKVKL